MVDRNNRIAIYSLCMNMHAVTDLEALHVNEIRV